MRCLSFLEIMNKNNQIIIISFSDIYRQQHFYEELKENNQEAATVTVTTWQQR